jgi:hypothetical protein
VAYALGSLTGAVILLFAVLGYYLRRGVRGSLDATRKRSFSRLLR